MYFGQEALSRDNVVLCHKGLVFFGTNYMYTGWMLVLLITPVLRQVQYNML